MRWLAPIGFVFACSPAPTPKPAAAELVVPPIVDAGALPIVGRPPPPPAVPSKSAEEIALDDCRQLLRHITNVTLDGSGLTPDQRGPILDSIMQSLEQASMCEAIDDAARACMLNAKTTADLSNCAQTASSTHGPPTAPTGKPTLRPKRTP